MICSVTNGHRFGFSIKRRALSRIYRLGEKSPVAKLPRGVWGACIYCNDNNIFGGEAEHFGGESFYPSNTLDRTLQTVEVEKWILQPSLLISVYSTEASRPSNQIIEIKQNKIKKLTSLLLILTWPRSRTGVYWEYRISIATFLHRL